MDAHQQQIRDEKLGQWEPIIDQCLKEWEEYGSKTRWCKAHDISTSSFFYWQGCLTRNGRGSAVLMSPAQYERLTNPLEAALDEADRMAKETGLRLTHEEVFTKIRARK